MIYAALDIGTNSTLLLTARPADPTGWHDISEFACSTRLGDGVDARGRLQADAIARTLAAVTDFLSRLPRGREPILGAAAATSAVRDAVNRDQFLTPLTALLGAPPAILSGEAEARGIFLGSAGAAPPDRLVVCIDVGGGSTEIAAGYANDCVLAASLDLGCVRFAERFGLQDGADTARLAQASQAAAALLAPVCRRVRQLYGAATQPLVLASAGTATTVAAALQQLQVYDPQRVHGFVVSLLDLENMLTRLAPLPAAARAAIPAISADRAPVLPAGMLIWREALRLLETPTCLVSTRGIRYGLLMQLRRGEIEPTWQW